MKKLLLIGLVLLGVAAAPREASATCTDAQAQGIINGQNTPSIILSGGGAVSISNNAPGVSGCDILARVQANYIFTCQSASPRTGAWCEITGAGITVTARGNITGILDCGMSATVYGQIGRGSGGSWIYSTTAQNGVTRNCNSASALFEEDCEQDGQWEWQGNGTCTTLGSPILISTGKDKPGLKDYKLTDKSNGVLFDIDNNGSLDQVSWTKQGAALEFLALDRNGNGVIDNGSELFGNHTVAGAKHGFEALASLSGETVEVNASNPLFASLLLWKDANHDGVSQPEELRPFSSQFSIIYTVAVPSTLTDEKGNQFKYIGLVEEAGSRDTRVIYDVFFVKQ